MCLYALNIVNDLTLHAFFSDSHVEEILQERLELRVFGEWAVRAISILLGSLTTLCYQYTIKACNFFKIIFVRADFARIFQNLVLHLNYFLI